MEIRRIQKEQAWQLRHEVMWPERELAYVQLSDDDEGVHYGLFEGDALLSVVSLFIRGEEAQFRKFATKVSDQGKGYGSHLLRHMLTEAKQAGVKRIFCNARSNKVSFYEKFGLAVTDKQFTKGGKDYVVMEHHVFPELDLAEIRKEDSHV
ncbi:GNAT family N-acetyltransferase [Paenibacillus chondroitinus]|uniref:GNAT family N-acetyltransferase n=1 Tax=Paenibacillus chondroitinus TaxID=59842 RepID=A0ABU6DI02_9BACL|nr:MULTISPECIES: GNAT family N-acetyltransferase [Paenibacillus]MCY9662215.1 GNAT family N-acetyltransferase [Paenibacillus anseongense]MEB4797384.1 GNAT family N-acetyltransferase [Paenibacillus chondroitinus]